MLPLSWLPESELRTQAGHFSSAYWQHESVASYAGTHICIKAVRLPKLVGMVPVSVLLSMTL
jgi:hypothetical protein